MKPKFIIGIDEVGRGPLAGPMTVCAVVIPASFDKKKIKEVRDSKKLREKNREEWYRKAREWKRNGEINYFIRSISAKKIDEIGIARATRYLVGRVLQKVEEKNTTILLDGLLYAPKRFKKQKTIIHGDAIEPVISFASVIAKVFRDRKMKRLAKIYPQYGFDKHVRYGTAMHYKAIKKYGLTPEHRRSFLKNLN